MKIVRCDDEHELDPVRCTNTISAGSWQGLDDAFQTAEGKKWHIEFDKDLCPDHAPKE